MATTGAHARSRDHCRIADPWPRLCGAGGRAARASALSAARVFRASSGTTTRCPSRSPRSRARKPASSCGWTPNLLPLIEGRRVVLVDDAISTGTTAVAAARLMQRVGADMSGMVVAMKQTNRWEAPAAALPHRSRSARSTAARCSSAMTPAGSPPRDTAYDPLKRAGRNSRHVSERWNTSKMLPHLRRLEDAGTPARLPGDSTGTTACALISTDRYR